MRVSDRYSNFRDLQLHECEGCDYRIRWRFGSTGITILSIHGGDIEPGTSEIADAIAGEEHTFYALEGIKGSGNLSLHITSTAYDEPTALEIICHSAIILSIHGCAEPEVLVHLGGLDREVRERIGFKLRKGGFSVRDFTHLGFRATDQRNICNLCGRGMGVQMEVSRGLRSEMFEDLTQGRKHPTETFYRFTQRVREAIEPFSEIFLEEPLEPTD